MSSSEAGVTASAIHACIDELQQTDAADVCDGDLQRLMAHAVRIYAQKVERFGGFPAVPGGTITPTDAMIATSALLRAVNVQVFELGCWQNWAG